MSELSEAEVNTMKESIEVYIKNIEEDFEIYQSADKLTDLVNEHRLERREECKPLLKHFITALEGKGFKDTAAFVAKQWNLN
jgi:hypothetical protein